jgi:hypothetical protein
LASTGIRIIELKKNTKEDEKKQLKKQAAHAVSERRCICGDGFDRASVPGPVSDKQSTVPIIAVSWAENVFLYSMIVIAILVAVSLGIR